MNILDFQKWMQHRKMQKPKEMPESDRLLQVIAAAGPRGISRYEIGQQIKLDRHILDDLSSALVQMGQISATHENGDLIYRVPQ